MWRGLALVEMVGREERFLKMMSDTLGRIRMNMHLFSNSNHFPMHRTTPRRAVVATQRTESVTTRGQFSNRSRGITVPALRRTLALPVSGSSLLPRGYCRVRSFNSLDRRTCAESVSTSVE